jgi:hypothetical protein
LYGALRGHELLFLLAADTPESIVPPGAERRRLPVRAAAPLRRWLALRLPAEGDVLLTDHYPAGSIPTVITLHDDGGPWWRRRLIARHLRRAAAVVAVSEAVRAAWGVDAAVIGNGVAVPRDLVVPAGEHLLVCDPGLAHKGADVARAAARAVGRELRAVGRGVRWLPQAELFKELAGAAAVLCPSRREGFGMVPLEAMALGRPVVVADLPAYREVLGPHAFYAAPGGWEAAVRRALDCDAALLDAARAHARTFTWGRSARELEGILERLRTAPG